MKDITRAMVLACAIDCDKPTGDAVLDELHDKYNEGSPRDDWPHYYRFLRNLSKTLVLLGNDPVIFIELGCHYGAASFHFLSAAGADAYGIDVDSRIKPQCQHSHFRFMHGRSDNACIVGAFPNEFADVLLIDTDHSYDTTKNEFALWEPKARKGGVILFDDIDEKSYGCGTFFRELPGEKIELPQLHPDGWGFGVWLKE